MVLPVQFQVNPRAKPFVSTVKANKLLQHRLGKREEGKAPVCKHHNHLGRVRWASRRGEGESNSSRKTKCSGVNGGRNWRTQIHVYMYKKYKTKENTWHKKEAQRQSGTMLCKNRYNHSPT